MQVLTTMRLVVAGSFFVLPLLVSCSSVAPQEVETISAEPTSTPTQTAEPTPSKTELETQEESTGSPQPCGEETLNAIQETINSQISAFGGGDYEAAYDFASPVFQASVTLEGFVQIIEGSYGPLISSSSLVFSDCLTNEAETAGLVDVRFIQQSNDVYALRYLMINTENGWRVQGASSLQVVGEGA